MSRAALPTRGDRWHPVTVALGLAALTALAVGVPIVLVAAGGVPFRHDGLTGIQRSLSTFHSGDPRTAARWIATVALVLAWSVWAWMILCVGIELRSWLTGRPPARLPASRTAQSVAAFLVGTTLAVSAIGRGATVPSQGASPASWSASFRTSDRTATDVVPIADLLSAVAGPVQDLELSARPAGVVVRAPVAPSSPADSLATPLPTGPLSSDSGRVPRPAEGSTRRMGVATNGAVDPLIVPATHLVCSRETLWSIAETELGSALRWHELAELNYGITQADGRALDEGHWISPGWRLLLPPAAVPPAPTVPTTSRVHPVPTPRSARSSPSRPVGSAWSQGPTEIIRPPSPLLSHAVPESRTDADTGAAPDPATPDPIRSPPAPSPPSAPLVPLGAGVVGAGVARLLDRMRQVQQRYRADGRFIRLPDGAGSQIEGKLRIGDGWGLTGEVDEAIRQCALSTLEMHLEPTPLLGVRVHPEVIELVPSAEGGPAIVVDRATLTASPSRHSAPPPGRTPSPVEPRAVAPLLVTVGRGSSGPVMVNLESLGSLVVSGNPETADAVVRALALELATSFWSGQFSLLVVGFGSELERFDGVRCYPEVAGLVHTLCRRRIAAAARLDTAGYSSFAHARLVEPSDRWSPLVVICGPTVTEADVNELVDVAADPAHGSAVVAVGERIEAQYSVRIDGGGGVASLDLLADVVAPQRIAPEELEEVTVLLDTAASRQSVLRSEEPYVSLPIRLPQAAIPDLHPVVTDPATRPIPDAADPAVAAPTGHTGVEVVVLGPVGVRGAARPFTRAWAEELVVYLAMHPNGASNDAWATALWPDRLMAPSSLHSIASVARRSLGQATDGTDYLPRSHGRLALLPTVRTDWDSFVALADSDSVERWHAALTLIRGRPFEGLRSSDWPILEGIAPAIEAAIVDLSGRLAGAYLKLGNARGAEWAARRGLVVSPYDERLYRMLMRASDLGGNPAGVDAAMSELLTLVADGIEPLDAVHPSTMELYRQLSRRKKFRASGR